MTTVAMVSRYARTGASSRLRMFQYRAALEADDFVVQQYPLLGDRYLQSIYAGKGATTHMLASYLGRIGQLMRWRGCDVLWLEKEVFPWLPHLLERVSLPGGVPVVTDYDDAVFHNYDLHGSQVVRRLMGRKIDRLMAASSLVTAGNSYLAERARDAGAQRVEIVPTVVDITQYTVRPKREDERPRRVGWIGTPSTWTAYMAPMMPLLAGLATEGSARIMAVGAGRATAEHPLLDSLPWMEASEVTHIQDMDIGIMPLTDTPWARGKCGYKLIQYMACGLPVVASPVGVNADIVEHGVNGFLASTEAEWRSALGTLLSDPDLRHRMGVAGRKKIERNYSLQVWGPRVAGMLREATVRGGAG